MYFIWAVAAVHETIAEEEGGFSRQKFSRIRQDSPQEFGIQSEIHGKQMGKISECLEYYNL